MPELLFEIFCEEIPARLQRKAANDLKEAVSGALIDNGLMFEDAAGFVTPRRMVVAVFGIPARSPDTRQVRKGPRVGAPDKAVAGFLRAAGLDSIADAQIETDPRKGDYYTAVLEKKGQSALEILQRVLPDTIRNFSWGKPMNWGSSSVKWVRPIRSIAASFGPSNEEPETVDFAIDGVRSGQTSFGHRFMAPGKIPARRFEEYVEALEGARVVLDLDRRMEIVAQDAGQLAFANGLELVEDKGLLEEVAGLVEWPVTMLGAFEESFLELPEEVIIATIKSNQKCFCLRNRETKRLANQFVLVSNMVAEDGGKAIVAGNERVIRARLADAMFFYHNDLKRPLENNLEQLKAAVFHQKLGSQADRVARIGELAVRFAPMVGADPALVARAALLSKADLASEMVVEFTDLQGLMGRYYAQAQGEDGAVADAIEMHYKPVGPSDRVPDQPVAIAVALADKLDMLSGFWSINEKPTGSRDPFALRRAALGVIRIILENGLRFPLEVSADLLAFFHDRLKVLLRESGVAHDLVDALLTPNSNDLLEIQRRVQALSGLLRTEAGTSLLAGYRRGANILAAEEKKSGTCFDGKVNTDLLEGEEEKALAEAVETARALAELALGANDYGAAVAALAELRRPVDGFFEHVLVNDPDPEKRRNRLNLLARLRQTMHLVADFSRIEG
ncbi:MAG TPA: glycine--tRNA ligase subunit beta [Devosia sp.]|nr:glycine--tRNA ligase subunit beta [Devosia sp.]